MSDGWSREIVELHEFFEGWLSGTLPATDAAFVRFEQVTSTGFTFVGPNASVLDRSAVLTLVRDAHGARPGLRIRIENPTVHHELGPLLVATYEEWQKIGTETTARLSTALFRARHGTPCGVEWLHVHETWLPTPGRGKDNS